MSNVLAVIDALSKLTDGELAVLKQVLTQVQSDIDTANINADLAVSWSQYSLKSQKNTDLPTGVTEPAFQSVTDFPIIFGNADSSDGTAVIPTRSLTFAFGSKAFLGYANDAHGNSYHDTSYSGGSASNLGEIEVVNYRTMMNAIQTATGSGSGGGGTGGTDNTELIAQINNSLTGLVSTVSTLSTSYNITATAYETTATLVTSLNSTVNGLNGLPASFSSLDQRFTTLAGAHTTTAGLVTSLNSTINDPNSGIIHTVAGLTETLRTTANDLGAISTLTTNLNAQLNNPTTGVAASLATLTQTYNASANVNSATATNLGTLTSAVNGHTASIGTLTQTIANLGGSVSTWSVNFNSDGVVSGLSFTSTTAGQNTTSDFRILANTFELVDAGHPSIKPLAYANGNLSFNGNVTINGNTSFAEGYSPTSILSAAAIARNTAINDAIAAIGIATVGGTATQNAINAIYTTYGGSATTTTIHGGVLQSGTVITGKMEAGFMQTAFLSISDTLSTSSYQAGTPTSPPTGVKLTNTPFVMHLLEGGDITGNLEIGGEVSIGGYKAAVITGRLFNPETATWVIPAPGYGYPNNNWYGLYTGQGIYFTPRTSNRIQLYLALEYLNVGVTVYYGTGTKPGMVPLHYITGAIRGSTIISNLTIGTRYWIDLLVTSTGLDVDGALSGTIYVTEF